MEPAIDTPASSSPARDHLPGTGSDSAGEASQIEVQASPSLKRQVDTARIARWLQIAAGHAARLSGRRVQRITVLVMGDAQMCELHSRHKGLGAPTDVLSFDLSADASASVEADIAINADEAARRAEELGHPLERELLLYALHGLLHCAGFDDRDEAAYQAMHEAEDRILSAIGVGATFKPTGDGGESP